MMYCGNVDVSVGGVDDAKEGKKKLAGLLREAAEKLEGSDSMSYSNCEDLDQSTYIKFEFYPDYENEEEEEEENE